MATLILLAGCGSDRPGVEEWRADWQTQRDSLPGADAFMEAGRSGCDDLLGRLRLELDELRTTPSEEVDGEFEAWAARAESLAFECPDDRDEVSDRLDELDVLAQSIDAALAAS